MIDHAPYPSSRREHDCRTPEVYRAIMSWLRSGGPNAQWLSVPVLDTLGTFQPFPGPLDSVPMRRLDFRRIQHPLTLVPGAEYLRRDRVPVRIWYDPNWESYLAIDDLLREAD